MSVHSIDKLLKKIVISGKIKALSGIAIGGTDNALSIGGIDNAVIRNPIDNKPYIPGSSLKGKMRSLLELFEGKISVVNMGAVKFGPYDGHKDSQENKTEEYSLSKLESVIPILFGNTRNDKYQRPSRVIVRDSRLLSEDDLFKNTELPYTEAKTEVVIDRITSKAMPRQMERVPAGSEFSLDIVLNIFEKDVQDFKEMDDLGEDAMLKKLIKSLLLLQDDYVGGSGSRGSGQIEFVISKCEERDSSYYLEGKDKGTDRMDLIPSSLKEISYALNIGQKRA